MQHYLHIGGDKDSLSYPAQDGAETVQWQLGVTDKETYNRSTLSVGGVSITIYIHESLTSQQALNKLAEHYKAWCDNRPGAPVVQRNGESGPKRGIGHKARHQQPLSPLATTNKKPWRRTPAFLL